MFWSILIITIVKLNLIFLIDIIDNMSFGSLKVQEESLIGQRFFDSRIEMDSQNIGKVSTYLISRNKLRLNLGISPSVTFTGNLHFHLLLLTILLVSCPSC